MAPLRLSASGTKCTTPVPVPFSPLRGINEIFLCTIIKKCEKEGEKLSQLQETNSCGGIPPNFEPANNKEGTKQHFYHPIHTVK